MTTDPVEARWKLIHPDAREYLVAWFTAAAEPDPMFKSTVVMAYVERAYSTIEHSVGDEKPE